MQCPYTEIAQRIFKYSDKQYINLTLDKELNSLIYRTLFYVNIYGSCKLSKNSPLFLAHPVLCMLNRLKRFYKSLFCIKHHCSIEVILADSSVSAMCITLHYLSKYDEARHLYTCTALLKLIG